MRSVREEFERDKILKPLHWAVRVLWLAAIILIVFLIVIPFLPFDFLSQGRHYLWIITIVVVLINSVNTFFVYIRKNVPNSVIKRLLTVNVITVQFLMAVAVNVTGGIESVAVHLFHVVTLVTIASYSFQAVIGFSVFTGVLLGSVYTLEHFGILHHFPRYTDASLGIFGNAEATVFNSITTIAWIILVATFGAVIGSMIRQRENEILAERHRISVILRDLPDGILLVDRLGKLIFINPAAEYITGIPSEKVLNRIFTAKEKVPEFSRIHDLLFTEPQAVASDLPVSGFPSFEYVVGGKDREHVFQVTPLWVQEADGSPMGRMVIVHDITREKLVEKLKSEFISVAAHQLRTPLTAIKWALQMVKDGDAGPLNQEQRSMLEKGFVSNQRMINLVNDLLDASRIEEGRFRYDVQPVSAEEMIMDLANEFDHSLKERKIEFHVNVPSTKMPALYGDPQKLRMVFQNLIDNAIRYTKAGGAITVSLSYDTASGMILFQVSDTGVGIPESQRERIFSKFFRADNVVRMQTEGSGLGLFIVKNIVESHHGSISFDSEEGKGTTFHVWLPSQRAFGELAQQKQYIT